MRLILISAIYLCVVWESSASPAFSGRVAKLFGEDFFEKIRNANEESSGGTEEPRQSSIENFNSDKIDEEAVVISNETSTGEINFILSDSVSHFTRKLVQKIVAEDNSRSQNVVVSPFSIHLALSMLYYASPTDSVTHQQLSEGLGLNIQDSTLDTSRYLYNYAQALLYYKSTSERYNATVSLANRIFLKEGSSIKQDYGEVMKLYQTSVDNTVRFDDGTAEGNINQWVSERTKGLIPELLTPGSLDLNTLMVLVNAIYYKANWLHPFVKALTTAQDFKLADGVGSVRHNDMMIHPRINIRAGFDIEALDGASVLELPYENEDFNMYVGLPEENTIAALNQLAVKFRYAAFKDTLLPGTRPVAMPKFESNFEANLNQVLKAMGMTDMFDYERADFSDLTDVPEVAVTQVAHEAVVKVDEAGSEAAAATAAVLGTRTVALGGKPFKVDRPFVFMIHDKKHDVPLFFGRILNPSGSFGTRNENLAAALEQANRDDCLEEVGYEASFEPSVSFPCRGRDTLPIEKSKEETQKLRQEQIEDLAEAKAKDEFQ